MITLTAKQLRQAADLKEKIDELQAELSTIMGGEVPTPSQTAKAPKKRKMSAQGLANIRAGVAKRMAAQGKAVQKPKQKRKMTDAWRKALERAWAARRAKGKAAEKA